MPNNPILQYKTELFMSKTIPVELSAGDWAVFCGWLMSRENLDGVSYIAQQIADQVANAIYTAASIKAVQAAFQQMRDEAERAPFDGMLRVVRTMTGGNDKDEDDRCGLCGRLPGTPSYPCPGCKDAP